MYEIEYDRGSRTLNLCLTGFWTAEIMTRFTGEFAPLVEGLVRREEPFVILSDCRGYPVQCAEIGEAWARLLGPDTAIRAPYAVVVGSTLNKLQAGRALTAPNVRVFTAMDDAARWLGRS